MNKLPSIAFFVLLFLGGALWFTASGSLNQYVKSKLIKQGTEFTGHEINVKSVDVQTSLGKIELLDFTVSMLPLSIANTNSIDNTSNIDAINSRERASPHVQESHLETQKSANRTIKNELNNELDTAHQTDASAFKTNLAIDFIAQYENQPLLEIANITGFFDNKKSNESPVVIENIVLSGVKFHYSVQATEKQLIQAIKQQLSLTINSQIAQLTDTQPRKQANFMMNNIVLKDIVIYTVPDMATMQYQPSKRKILAQVNMLNINISDPKAAYPLTILSSKALLASLVALTEQAEQQLLINELMAASK